MDKVTLIHIASEACVWLGTVFFLQKEISGLQSEVKELKNTVNQLIVTITQSHVNKYPLPSPMSEGGNFGGTAGIPQGYRPAVSAPNPSMNGSKSARNQLTEEEYAEYIRHMQRMKQQKNNNNQNLQGSSSESKMIDRTNYTQNDELDSTLQELGEIED